MVHGNINIEDSTFAGLDLGSTAFMMGLAAADAIADQLFHGSVSTVFHMGLTYQTDHFTFREAVPQMLDHFGNGLIVHQRSVAHQFQFFGIFQHTGIIHRGGTQFCSEAGAFFQQGQEEFGSPEFINADGAVFDAFSHHAHVVVGIIIEMDVQTVLFCNREHMVVEQLDPSLNPALLSRFATETETPGENSLVVFCEDTGRWRTLGPEDYVSVSMDPETGDYSYGGWTYERSITNAISWVSRERVPKVAVVQGHGELDGETVEHFDGLLTANRFEVVYADLADPAYVPDPEDLLVFFSPQKDLNEEEIAKVKEFAALGGSFLFTCDYTDPVGKMPGYAALLRSYGFIPLDGIVLADRAAQETYYNGNRMYLIPEMCSTDLTLDLLGSGANRLLLPGCRGFEEPEETDRNLMTAALLRSGKSSYLKQVSGGSTSLEKSEGDADGPFALALQARRVTESGYISRACIIGCSGALVNEQVYAMTDIQPFIVRMAEFLLDMEASDLDILAKEAIRPALGTGSIGPGAVLLAALPAAVLLAALLVLGSRRRFCGGTGDRNGRRRRN